MITNATKAEAMSMGETLSGKQDIRLYKNKNNKWAVLFPEDENVPNGYTHVSTWFAPPLLRPAKMYKEIINTFKEITSQYGQRKAAATSLGVSPQQLNHWINGHNEPTGENLLKIMKYIEEKKKENGGLC